MFSLWLEVMKAANTRIDLLKEFARAERHKLEYGVTELTHIDSEIDQVSQAMEELRVRLDSLQVRRKAVAEGTAHHRVALERTNEEILSLKVAIEQSQEGIDKRRRFNPDLALEMDPSTSGEWRITQKLPLILPET